MSFKRILFLFLTIQACNYQHAKIDSQELNISHPSWQQIYDSVLGPNCVSCHSDSNASGGVSVASYESLMRSNTIVPFNPESSSLYVAISNKTMPKGGSLTDSQIALVKSWISEGAEFNSTSSTYQTASSSALKLISINPNQGSTQGQTLISLLGEGFTSDMKVMIDGNLCTSLDVTSSTNAVCITPAHAAGMVNINIQAQNQNSNLDSAFTYLQSNAQAPTISSVTPNSGISTGGTLLTISGSGFDIGNNVLVGGVVCANISISSSTTLTCTSPAHSLGPVNVVVTNSLNQAASLSNAFTYYLSSTFDEISKNVLKPKCISCHSGAGASAGMDFSTYTSTMNTRTITAGNANASSFFTALLAGTMPKGSAPLSTYELNPIRDWINGGALNNSINVLQLTSLVPNSGLINGNTTVTINGTGFTAGTIVRFDNIVCPNMTFVSSTKIICITPAHALGSVLVSAENSGTTSSLTNGFTYTNTAAASPVLSSITPTSGANSGGTLLTINGSNFQQGSVVSIDGVSCSNLSFISSSQMTCSIPPHFSGTVSVTVTNPDNQTSSLSNAFTYTLASTFASLNFEIFQPKCASCHSGSRPSAGYNMGTYSGIMSKVIPRNPSSSDFYSVIVDNSMPRGSSPLSSNQKQMIYNWILNGAQNN